MMKITIKVQPNSKKSSLEVLTLEPLFIKVKTQKPAQDGLANKDIIKQLALFLNCPPSHINIIQGLTSSKKIITVPFNTIELTDKIKQQEGFLL